MAIKTSGSISLGNIQAEFGGTVPHSLSEYYYAGALVKSNNNGKIPSSGTNKFSNYYGAQKGTIRLKFNVQSENRDSPGDRIGYRQYSLGNDGILKIFLDGTGDTYNITLDAMPRDPMPVDESTDYGPLLRHFIKDPIRMGNVNFKTVNGSDVAHSFKGLSTYAGHHGYRTTRPEADWYVAGANINGYHLLSVKNLTSNKTLYFRVKVGWSMEGVEKDGTPSYAKSSDVDIMNNAGTYVSTGTPTIHDVIKGTYETPWLDLTSRLF